MRKRKTPIAADEIGCSYSQLIGLLRYRKIRPPQRDSSGDYLWSDADLRRAKAALAKLERRRPTAERLMV
jgi:hypothetical protein